MNELKEYRGAIHVHTAYSDSAGRMPYVIQCARDAGLDFVVVSDHDSLLARRQGWEGWHDGVLLVIAVEISSLHGHALVFGLDACPRWRDVEPDEYLPEVRRLGGTAFIAHPERTQRGKIYRRRQIWPDLQTDDYAGLEIWSYMHDWIEGAYPLHPVRGIRDPDSLILGPHPEVLAAWDKVALRRHTAGLGALDAHELRLPIPKLRWSLLKILPLSYLFRTVRTHVLMKPWTGDADADIAALLDALARGRAFIAYDWLADSTGARFDALRRGEPVATVGDEITNGRAHGDANPRAELEFVARLPRSPRDPELVILRNAEPVARTRGTELIHRDSRPGVYRLEAHLAARPWIFSNHIYHR